MRTNRRDHVSPVLASLHWLPVKFKIEFQILLLTYKALNDRAPSYLKDLIAGYFLPLKLGLKREHPIVMLL